MDEIMNNEVIENVMEEVMPACVEQNGTMLNNLGLVTVGVAAGVAIVKVVEWGVAKHKAKKAQLEEAELYADDQEDDVEK